MTMIRKSYTIQLIFFWWYLLVQYITAFYRISPEKLISLSLEACSYERQSFNDNVMILFPETIRSCGSFYTNKMKDDYDNDLKHVTSLEPIIQIIWHEMNSPNSCKLEYKGYQRNYRITPDLGYYIGCQKALSQYLSQLAIRKIPPIWNTTNANCPLKSLPKDYEDYLACDFIHGKWYEILFKSMIRYEIYYKKVYRTFWSNYSSIFLIRPSFLIKTNYTEIDWLSKLISLKVRPINCDDAEFSVNIDSNWSQPISLIIHYRIRINNHIHYISLIANRTVEDWMSGTFVLIPSYAIHEVCYQMRWKSYEQHFENCVPFQINKKCFGSNDAYLTMNRNIIMILMIVINFTVLSFIMI
ncbi:Ferrochelatase [Dirofilaria immitis]